jgi:hypothetical protein
MASDGYHESLNRLTKDARNMHRAIVSLKEELEAIDWYQERADACSDRLLKDVLLQYRNEEIEHATAVMEWIRRHDGHFDAMMRAYQLMLTEQPITGVEKGTGTSGSAPCPPRGSASAARGSDRVDGACAERVAPSC